MVTTEMLASVEGEDVKLVSAKNTTLPEQFVDEHQSRFSIVLLKE